MIYMDLINETQTGLAVTLQIDSTGNKLGEDVSQSGQLLVQLVNGQPNTGLGQQWDRMSLLWPPDEWT